MLAGINIYTNRDLQEIGVVKGLRVYGVPCDVDAAHASVDSGGDSESTVENLTLGKAIRELKLGGKV